MKIEAKDAKGYLAAIPAERRASVEALRALVKRAVPSASEGIVWGMLGYAIEGRPFVAIASQKNYLSLYLCDLYTQPALKKKHEKALSKLKMGKSCINFQSVDELPLATIEAIVAEAPNVAVKGGTLSAEGFAKSRARAKATATPKKTAGTKSARARS
jgi:uncharacterized protein YdhG (YjbR/CyaY superfamily)